MYRPHWHDQSNGNRYVFSLKFVPVIIRNKLASGVDSMFSGNVVKRLRLRPGGRCLVRSRKKALRYLHRQSWRGLYDFE